MPRRPRSTPTSATLVLGPMLERSVVTPSSNDEAVAHGEPSSGATSTSGATRTAGESGASTSAPGWMHWVTRISMVVGLIALIATVWFVGPHAIIGHLRAIGWFFVVIIALEILSSVFDATAVYFMA